MHEIEYWIDNLHQLTMSMLMLTEEHLIMRKITLGCASCSESCMHPLKFADDPHTI